MSPNEGFGAGLINDFGVGWDGHDERVVFYAKLLYLDVFRIVFPETMRA
jgi:hypothetical protein